MVKKIFLSVFIVALIYAIFSWQLDPSVKPSEIMIHAKLAPIKNAKNVLPFTDCDYVLEITLNKKTAEPLSLQGRYTYMIYPYINGNSNPYWEMDNENNYTIGNEGNTDIQAVKELYKSKVISDYSKNVFLLHNINGVKYIGKDYPAQIKFYMNGERPVIRDKSFVVFSYYEKRFGKNVSWVKIFPVNIDIEQ